MYIKIKVISIVGYSGSGKTFFILNAIRLLREHLNYKVAVIKYIHEHEIDKKGKDSYNFIEEGAFYSITKNIYNETTIFMKKEITIEQIVKWLEISPFRVDIVFAEGFRDLNYPTILCVKQSNQIGLEMNGNVKIISGLIVKNEDYENIDMDLPILDVTKDFGKILEIFEIK